MAEKKLTNLFTATGAAYTAPLNADSKKLSNLYGESYKSRQNAGGLGGGLAYIGASVAAGAGGMAEGAFDLVYGMSALIGGNKRYAENLFKDNVVGEWHKDIRDDYNPDKIVSFFGDVGQGLGQSATMLIPVVGKVGYYAGAIGQGIGEATQLTGELGVKETAYGTVVGVIEGTLELVLGQAGSALGKIGGKAGASISSKLGSAVLNKWAASAVWKGVAKDMISSAGGEFLEEFLSEYIDVGLKRGFKIDENATTSLGQALYAGLVGAASGAAMGGAVSGISSEYAYRSGKRVVDAGNTDVLIKETRSMVDSLKIDSKSVKVDDILVNLQKSLDMYDKAVAAGNERGATIYLGEIKTYRGILEVSYSVQREAMRLASVDEATAERAAKNMSYEDGNREVSKNYTAKDFYENKNDIRTRLAAMSWAGVFMSDSQAMRESAIFDAEIYADKVGAADGSGVVQDVDGAVFPENGGTFKIAAGDIQTAEGDYMRVMRTGEDSYAIGIGNDSQSAHGRRSLTREQAEAEFKRIQGQVIANREKVAQAQNLAAQAEAARAQADELSARGSFATKSERRAADKAATLAEQQAREGVPGAEAVTTDAGEAQIGNSFEQSTMNAARRAVKNFDALDIDTKRRILRWVESAEGHNISKDVISGISNIMRIRGDLQVLLAETREGVEGFHKKNAAPGRNLIVLPSNRDVDILRETIAHELGHEVEGVEGFDQIKKAALKATKAEDIKEWKKLYEGYPDADTEVAMKALGRRLATPKFIARYADRSLLRRIVDVGRDFINYLRADEAAMLELAETEKLIKMMNEALIKGEVSQNEAKGESGTKRYNITAADKAALKTIGQNNKRHVNDFDSNDIKLAKKWAEIYWNGNGTEKPLREKSPFFRAWFGEWRAYSTDPVEVVTKQSDTRGLKKNKDTGWDINRSSKISGERHASTASTAGRSYLPYIDSIIENAVLLDSAISDKDNENSLFYHYMYAVVDDCTGKHVVKLTVEELLNPGKETERRAYKLIDIEKYQPSAGGSQNTSLTSSLKAGTINTIADLVEFVKGYDKNYQPRPVNPALLNGDGTPKVFYHGTTNQEEKRRWNSETRSWDTEYEKFYTFKRTYDEQIGHFFADDYDNAGGYGSEVYEVYVSLRNPLVIDCKGQNYANITHDGLSMDTYEWAEWAKKKRYDGVIFLNVQDGVDYGAMSKPINEVVAFESNQIKSATENVGTFRYGSRDIRYNLTDEAADQAEREAADTVDQREKDIQKREDKAAKAERDAEIKRIETRARDYNAYYYKYDDVKALIDTINKEAKLGFSDASDAAFAAYSLLNAFRAEVYKADYRQSFLETTTDYLIEAADAQAGRELRLGDIDRRKKVYKMLNEAYEKLAKVTPKQKTEGRRARAEAEAQFEHKTAELHMLMTQVEVRRFREKTTGVLSGTQWKGLISALKGIRTRSAKIKDSGIDADRIYDIQPVGAYNFIKEFAAYIKANAESLYDFASSPTQAHAQAYDAALAAGDNQLYQKISLNTARKVLEFANSDGEFNDAAIEATVAAVKTVLAIDRWSDMYIRNGKAVDVEPLALDTLKGLKTSFDGIGGKFAQTAFGKALKYGIYNVISPEAVVRRVEGVLGTKYLSESIHNIQRASLDAQYDQMKFMAPLVEYIQKHKKADKQWWKEWQDQELSFTRTVTYGKKSETVTVKVTKGEAAAIYLTSLRYHALPAMALGRVTIANNDGKGGSEFNIRRMNFESLTADIEHQMENMDDASIESLMNGLIVQLKKDVNDLYAQFTDADKKFISEIEKWYQTTSKNVKKETDTLIYGSTNVYDGYYYPIQREGNEFAYDFIGMPIRSADDISVYGYAFNKNTVRYANAQLNINDALITLDRHSRQLAMYKNLTIPLQNLRLLYNYTLKPGEGAERGVVTGDIDTVRKYITTYVGPSKNGRGGFDQWIGDFANAAQKRNIGGKTEFDTVLDKLQGGYVVAALGLNPSSIAKQWSTIMQMVEEVPPHIWMKAYAPAENKDMMLEKSRYASVRKNNSEIYFAQGTTAKLNDAMSYTLKGLEAGDYFVNLRMWNMAQYYVAETKGYSVGSEQNLNAAGKVLDEWILRFQDTSDATTKSALQRHPQKLAQTVTMFTSAPMKKFSSWYTHLTDAIEADRLIKSGKLSDEDRKRAEKILADSKNKLAKSSGGIVAAAAFETAVTLLWAALRGKDDEDEEKKKSLVAKIALETSANVVGIVPVAGQIAESLLSGYDIDNMYESVINDGIGTVRTTYQLSAKALSGEQVESEAVMRNARSWVYLVSQTLGVPVRNLNNVFTAALNVISPVAPQAKYKYDAIFYEPTYAADMSKALKSGKTELAETIYRMSQKDIKTGGAVDSAVVSEMVRLYGMEYNVLPRSAPTSYEDAEGNTVKIKAAQSRQFSEIYGAADGAAAMVVTSPVYTALDDELKAKALRVVYEIYHSRAKTEVLGAEPSVMAALSYFEAYIDVPTLVAESAYIYGIKSTKDAKRSELVRRYVSGYSREAQAVLLYAAGYRSEDIKETLSEMLASLDEESQNRAKIKLDF